MAIVVGDGTGATALVNLDGLVQFVCLRGKAVANALRLTKDGQLNRTVTACGNAGEVQEFVIKQLKGVFGDSDAKFFGAKKWELLETTPNGSCGFEARALIAGFRGIGDDGLMDALSQTMRDLFASHHGSKNQSWMDTIDLIQDLLVNDHRFDGRVFWIRTIATMHIEHAKCAVTMRANTFKMNGQVGAAWVEDADLTPDGVLDLLVAYNGPYIIYTVEMIGASELGVSHNARHIQVFRNTDVVEPPHVDA